MAAFSNFFILLKLVFWGVARLISPSLYPNQNLDEPEYVKRAMAEHDAPQCIVGDYYGGAEEEDY